MREKPRLLEHKTNATLVSRRADRGVRSLKPATIEAHPSRSQRSEAGDGRQEKRLTGSRRAEQDRHSGWRKGEIRLKRERPTGHTEITYLETGRGRRAHPPSLRRANT